MSAGLPSNLVAIAMAARTMFTSRDRQLLIDLITPHIQAIEGKASNAKAVVACETSCMERCLSEFSGIFHHSHPLSYSGHNSVEEYEGESKKGPRNRKEGEEEARQGGGNPTTMGTISQVICDILPQEMEAAISDPVDCDAEETAEEEVQHLDERTDEPEQPTDRQEEQPEHPENEAVDINKFTFFSFLTILCNCT